MRSIVSQLIEKDENEVAIFPHSICGVLGLAAMEGLSLKERKERGSNWDFLPSGRGSSGGGGENGRDAVL